MQNISMAVIILFIQRLDPALDHERDAGAIGPVHGDRHVSRQLHGGKTRDIESLAAIEVKGLTLKVRKRQ